MGAFDFSDPIWDLIGEDAIDFAQCLLACDEEERPTALEALQHPWLVTGREASSKSFLNNTKRRSTMSQALQQIQANGASGNKAMSVRQLTTGKAGHSARLRRFKSLKAVQDGAMATGLLGLSSSSASSNS